MVEISSTSKAAGAVFQQYSPQPIGCPCFAATEVPTTFAEAPIGVALPPISVPIDNAHASTDRLVFWLTDRLLIIGIIVAAKGMLSTNALAMAETHIIIAVINFTFPPLIFSIKLAVAVKMPFSFNPPTTINKPRQYR